MEEFEAFCYEMHPKAHTDFQRSKLSWNDLVPGTVVLTLRAGFSGDEGEFRVISNEKSENDDWKYLEAIEGLKGKKHFGPMRSILSKQQESYNAKNRLGVEFWWQAVVPVDYDSIQSMNPKERREYINDILRGYRVQ